MKKNFKYRLFGRSKGRGKINSITDEAKKIKINKIDPSKHNIIDIGSGYGESTIEIAKKNCDKNVIACEKYIDGVNKIAENSKNYNLKNISIFNGNVHKLLDEYCLNNSIEEIWILFPDPWPKKRHYKRRLINVEFFIKLNRCLKKNSTIHIASDSKIYISQILDTVYKVKNDFEWINQNKEQWDYSNLALPNTKYFEKALKKGLNPFYLEVVKI